MSSTLWNYESERTAAQRFPGELHTSGVGSGCPWLSLAIPGALAENKHLENPNLVIFFSLTEAPLPDPTPTPANTPKRTRNGPETGPKRSQTEPNPKHLSRLFLASKIIFLF